MKDNIFGWLDGMRADADAVGRTDRPQPKRNRLRGDLGGAGTPEPGDPGFFFLCEFPDWDTMVVPFADGIAEAYGDGSKSLGELVADAILDAGGDCICPLGLPVCDGSHACGKGLE